MSRRARAYVRGMWLARDKEAFEGAEHTREVALERQRRGDAPPTRLTRLACAMRSETVAGMRVWVARPRRRTPRVRVLYLHGGGYVHPLSADYWRLVRALVRAPAEVVVPAYPLAPDHTVDEVLPRLVQVASYAAEPASDLPLVIMGDSAGGALSLVVTRRLVDGDGPVPTRVVTLCPWLDATLDEEQVSDLEATDPMLAESGLRAAGRWWSGPRPATDPEVSPVRMRLDGLPPVDLFIGERDILRPAVDDFARRCDQAGADLTVHEVPAMFHVWMTTPVPEGRRSRGQLRRLLGNAGAGPV